MLLPDCLQTLILDDMERELEGSQVGEVGILETVNEVLLVHVDCRNFQGPEIFQLDNVLKSDVPKSPFPHLELFQLVALVIYNNLSLESREKSFFWCCIHFL